MPVAVGFGNAREVQSASMMVNVGNASKCLWTAIFMFVFGKDYTIFRSYSS
jgi:hypothetical protein